MPRRYGERYSIIDAAESSFRPPAMFQYAMPSHQSSCRLPPRLSARRYSPPMPLIIIDSAAELSATRASFYAMRCYRRSEEAGAQEGAVPREAFIAARVRAY